MISKDEETKMPKHLSAKGKEAYKAIMAILRKYNATDTGGCKAFYSPKEWEEREEEYGTGSQLIVVYDGGAHRRFFNMDACYNMFALPGTSNCYEGYEEMQAALRALGLYFEECTCWYAAIYEG